MPSLNLILKGFGRAVSANSPVILTAMGVAGVISTSVMAVKATPEAIQRIKDAQVTMTREMTAWEKVKATYPCYIPAAAVGTVTIACIVSANSISTKRNAALMSLYSLTETGFREYQEKITETFGAQKEQKVRDEIAQDRINNDPVSNKEVVIVGSGEVLCYDTLSGRYFQSDMESIRRAVNDINQMVLGNDYASQNDFNRLLGLPTVGIGDELGWSTDHMLEVNFSTTLSEDGRPCISLDYKQFPIRGYYLFSG